MNTPDSHNLIGGFSALFVRRPVLAIVLNLLLIVAGLAALNGVEVRELPEVDNPVITVRTDYTGAAPLTVDREITGIIEGAAGRVPGVKSISSSSSFGRSRVTVEFTESTDLDVAASDLRDTVNRVSRDLPGSIDSPRIIKADNDAQPIMRMAITADSMPVEELTELVQEQLLDRFTSINGVADIQVYGDRERIFRIDVDQAKLATRGLSIGNLSNALAGVAFDTPTGSLTSTSQSILVRAMATVTTPAQFEQIIIDGRTRIGDVATVTLGAEQRRTTLRANGRPGIGMGIIRQSGSNALDISRAVRAEVDAVNKFLPEGVSLQVTSDDATFINGAIVEVIKTMGIAVLIVIAVIYLFLLNWRATLIPAITLPVALIGTIAGIWIAGFSINILTMLALVLATGLVVDDAIVVLENIVHHRHQGMPRRAAAVIGAREVFFAVVTTTATLAAVFIPLSFLPGKAGGLFREFGFVLAIAVTISSLVALSLTPMLTSRFLTDAQINAQRPSLFKRLLLSGGRSAVAGYGKLLRGCLRMPLIPLLLAGLFAFSAWQTFGTINEELVPREDRSVVLMRVTAPQGVSLEYTSSQLRRIEELVQPLVSSGDERNVFSSDGFGGGNRAFMVLTLAPWEQRERKQQDIATEINGLLRQVPGVRTFVIQPNSLRIRGAGSGLRMALVGDNYDILAETADPLVEALESDPQFGRVRLSYETNQPQLSIVIDRERAADLGIAIDGLASAMQSVLDGREVGKVFINDSSVGVKLVSTTHPVNDPTDLENIFLKAGSRIVPMSSIATVRESAVAPSLQREQKMRSVSISASLSPELSLRAAMNEMQRLANPLMPAGVRLIPLSEAATLEETSSGIAITFGFAIVVVFLVLAAQFESFVSSLIVMLTVPLGLGCAVFAMKLTGTSLNVYSQIGLVLLVGIMAKNGILIVEFANQLRDRGLSVMQAAEQSALRRVRPVLMTMISTVVGAVPLLLAFGAGAEARIALGWVIVGGLGMATLFTLFLTPVAYRLLAGLSASKSAETHRLEQELQAVSVEPAG